MCVVCVLVWCVLCVFGLSAFWPMIFGETSSGGRHLIDQLKGHPVTPIQRAASESAHQFTGSGSLFLPLGGRWRMGPDLRRGNLISSMSARAETGGSTKWLPELKNHLGCSLHQKEALALVWHSLIAQHAGLRCGSFLGESLPHTTAGRPLPSVPLESTWLLRFHCWHAVLPAVLKSRIHRGCPRLIRARLQPLSDCFAFSLDKLDTSVSRSFPLHAFLPELSAPPDSKVP